MPSFRGWKRGGTRGRACASVYLTARLVTSDCFNGVGNPRSPGAQEKAEEGESFGDTLGNA